MGYFVYELINLMGTIEYVGETTNPRLRFNSHKCKSGSFYRRNDIFINVVVEFDNRKDAFNYQCELQKEYGFITDLEKFRMVRAIGSKINGNKNITNGVLEKARNAMKEKSSIAIIAINTNTNETIVFNSLHDAARELNVSVGNVCRVLKGGRKSLKGFTFQYL